MEYLDFGVRCKRTEHITQGVGARQEQKRRPRGPMPSVVVFGVPSRGSGACMDMKVNHGPMNRQSFLTRSREWVGLDAVGVL